MEDTSFSKEFTVVHGAFYDAFEPWRKSLAHSPIQSGVYTLKSPIPVCRALEKDDEGVLYIGKGVILSPFHRLGNLINALNNTDSRHEAGVRYNKLRMANDQGTTPQPDYISKYPLNTLILRIEILEHPAVEEQNRLCTYLEKFGELPPLNRRL